MDVLLVNLAGAGLIAGIVWYFFLSRRPEAAAATAAAGVQEIQVTVKGGYSPDVIVARPGVPLRIHFRREETSACSEEVVFPDFGVRRRLPAFETTVVEIPAAQAGRYGFACGMDMLHGTLQVGEPAAAEAPAPRPRAASQEDWPVDPVCGMKVDPEHPAATLVRDDRTFYFCNPGCKDRFEKGGAQGPGEGRVTLQLRRRQQPPKG
jgi:plastocyanin domain-containing protein